MPAPTKPTAPTIPQRTQAPATFSANVDTFLTYIPTVATFMDEAGDWCDERATDADDSAIASAASASASDASATASASSAASSASSANYIGEWTGKTGAYSAGISVSHKGAFWRLNTSTATIQSIEPSVSASWTFVSGTRWNDLITSSQSVPRNSMNNIKTDGSVIEITMPSFVVNDFVVLHSISESVEDVRVLNPSHTIYGKTGSITAGDNLVLKSGDTVHLVYRATNILEIV